MDQLYTDQKFESYRVLGECAGDHAAEMMKPSRTVRQVEPPAPVPANGGGSAAPVGQDS